MMDHPTSYTLSLCLFVAVALEAIGQIEVAARVNLVQAVEEARGKAILADKRTCLSCHRGPMAGVRSGPDLKTKRLLGNPSLTGADLHQDSR